MADLKIGTKVSYYTETIRGGKSIIKHHTGVLIAHNGEICSVVPDGKQNSIIVPTGRILTLNNS